MRSAKQLSDRPFSTSSLLITIFRYSKGLNIQVVGFAWLVRQVYLLWRSRQNIIELKRANNLKQASALQTKLQAYELQYQMSSDIFYQKFSEGSLGDDMDYFEWSVFYELWQSVQERLQGLQIEKQ